MYVYARDIYGTVYWISIDGVYMFGRITSHRFLDNGWVSESFDW